MNVIKYNVNSGDVCQIGRQYEYGKTQVIFEGYQVIDSANEIYFKFVGRTDDSKYLIPIVDMTLDITQQLTKHVGQFRCQLEEMNTEGTLVSQSPVFYVAVKRSIKVGAAYEVQDPRLETIYQKYNEMYNIISQTNETSLANESQRQAEWITLKQEVADAVASIDGKLDWYKASTTDTLQARLNGFIGEAEGSIQTALETYETQTDSNINDKLTAYQSKTTSDINRMFDDSDRTSKEKIDALASELDQRRLAGEFNGSDGYTPVKGKDYFTESEIVQFKKDVTPKKRIDYFTDSEISQIQNEVSSGAIGEFRVVVQTETDKFNTNAANKVSEFDAHTEQIQTDISSLKSDVSANQSELGRTNSYLDALFKLNKGQTYDVLKQESEAYSVDVPSGSHYASVDKVGGKSIVWNQLISTSTQVYPYGGTYDSQTGTYEVTEISSANRLQIGFIDKFKENHKYLSIAFIKAPYDNECLMSWGGAITTINDITPNVWCRSYGIGALPTTAYAQLRIGFDVTTNYAIGDSIEIKNIQLFDLTQMFGSTIADYIYSLEQANAGAGVAWFKKLFPADYYPYSEPTIISSQTDRVDVRGKNLFDNSSMLDGYYDSSTGKFIANSATKATSKFKSNPSTNYILSVNEKSISGYLYEWRGDDYIGRKPIPITGVFTTSAETTLIAIALYDASASSIPVGALIQLEEGSVVTEYSPYSLQQIETGFPVLNSAGTVYDYIDLNEGKLHQRVGKVVIDGSQAFDGGIGVGEYGNVAYISTSKLNIKLPKGKYYGIISDRFNSLILDSSIGYNIPLYDMTVYNTGNLEIGWNYLAFCLPSTVTSNELTIEWFSNNPTTVYYELAEEIITDIEIPTELTDWLTVEAGGSVTFHNADEGKRLLVPNKLSFVRKLDEVSV